MGEEVDPGSVVVNKTIAMGIDNLEWEWFYCIHKAEFGTRSGCKFLENHIID